jgi:hypothetical protein
MFLSYVTRVLANIMAISWIFPLLPKMQQKLSMILRLNIFLKYHITMVVLLGSKADFWLLLWRSSIPSIEIPCEVPTRQVLVGGWQIYVMSLPSLCEVPTRQVLVGGWQIYVMSLPSLYWYEVGNAPSHTSLVGSSILGSALACVLRF